MRATHALSALALGVALAAAPSAVAAAQTGSATVPTGSVVGIPGLSRCSETVAIAVPGGTQSFPGIPSNLPHGGLTTPLAGALENRGISTRTIAYDATPFLTRGYADSQARGLEVVRAAVREVAEACPESRLSFVGYSEGADIASGVVEDIAAGRGPIPVERLSSSAFLANPDNTPRSFQTGTAGRGISGVLGAAEYGVAADRVLNVCAVGDFVCDDRVGGPGIRDQIKALTHSSALRGVDPNLDALALLPQAPHLVLGAVAHTQGYGMEIKGMADYVATPRGLPAPTPAPAPAPGAPAAPTDETSTPAAPAPAPSPSPEGEIPAAPVA